MKEERPSITAAIVATTRSLAALLPDGEHIAHDPFGARFLGGWAERAVGYGRRAPGVTRAVSAVTPLSSFILYIQVRTRALDDVLLDFVAGGGRQVVLLGAGYDCRALRFADRLRDTTVFEVDHPATQGRKRAVLMGAEHGAFAGDVRHLSFNFEVQPVAELPDALAAIGHRRDARTLVIWEGVTMYLTEGAIDASVAAVRALAAPGSLLALTYFERARVLESPTIYERVVHAAVAGFGEPFRFGWQPDELGPWYAARGFELVSDRSEVELAERLLPAAAARKVKRTGRHVAVLRRT